MSCMKAFALGIDPNLCSMYSLRMVKVQPEKDVGKMQPYLQ